MGKMVQIRNVPDDIHRIVKARAAMAGLSLSGYLLAEIRKFSERPTSQELLERLERLSPVRVRTSPARAVREERDRR